VSSCDIGRGKEERFEKGGNKKTAGKPTGGNKKNRKKFCGKEAKP